MNRPKSPAPQSMNFGQAMITGIGMALGFIGAAMLIHFSGDVYRVSRDWLLSKPNGSSPPGNGGNISGIYPLYRR